MFLAMLVAFRVVESGGRGGGSAGSLNLQCLPFSI